MPCLTGRLSQQNQADKLSQSKWHGCIAGLGVATACRAGHWQMLDWQLELGTGSWGLVYAQQGITAQAGVSGQGISDCLCINLKIVTNIWKLKLTECSCFVVAHKIACTMKITEFMGWMIWLHVEFIQVNSILKPDSGVANINFIIFDSNFFVRFCSSQSIDMNLFPYHSQIHNILLLHCACMSIFIELQGIFSSGFLRLGFCSSVLFSECHLELSKLGLCAFSVRVYLCKLRFHTWGFWLRL